MFSLNTEKIRQDFPLLQRKIDNKPIIYLDSSCMSLRPRQVIQKITDYYENQSACASRSAHRLAQETTDEVDNARRTLKKFLSAKNQDEIIFTKNTTEGINIVANSFNLQKNDTVLTSDREHNSNLVPWLKLKKQKQINHNIIESDKDMTFSLENFQDKLTKDVKLVSMVHSSNLDGYTLPVKEIIKIAHENESLVMLDAAQSAPHKEINVKKLNVDFLSLSGHKMLGPTATGVLYGKKDLLDELDTFIVGGDTVKDTTYNSYQSLNSPEKFEAGLQDYSGIIGLGQAASYLSKIGLNKIQKHEHKLNKIMTQGILDIKGAQILGPQEPVQRAGVASFTIQGINPHDIAIMLSQKSNIMVRSGAHCVHSWFNKHNLNGSCRASAYLYNTKEEAQTFCDELKDVVGILK